MADLFSGLNDSPDRSEQLGPGVVLLHGFALQKAQALMAVIEQISQAAPFRHLSTPGGHQMSVATTCCGKLGWFSDQYGYRYVAKDPATQLAWPDMPEVFSTLASTAALAAGYENFEPDSCLINRYLPGAKMSLHQDRNERDFSAPIVSVSLGLPAVFLFGGEQRSDSVKHLSLLHGDVLVWGGVSRLRFHGVMPIANDIAPGWGPYRMNLTFRLAG